MKNQQSVAVVGLGYVGLPLALLAARKGYKVIGIDADRDKITKLTAGEAPHIDGITSEAIRSSGITYSGNFALVLEADTVIICVPTPVDEHFMPNLGPVVTACRQVAQYIRHGQLIILESTVNPGVCETMVLSALESSGLRGGEDFHLAHCPERINPGDRNWSVANIPRVVGSLNETGLNMALKFYRSIVEADIHPMGSLKEAEAVKVVENSFRDINIAFVNELAMSFDKLGINVLNVIDGAATKPFAFMAHTPGCGVGGHCIPVDPYYLIEYARDNGFNHELLSMARSINRRMPFYTAHLAAGLLELAGSNVKGAHITVLGLSYKADIADTRESPAHVIVDALAEMGADVTVYDPYIESTFPAKSTGHKVAAVATATKDGDDYFETLQTDHPLAQVLEGADAVVIATGHRIFREADPGIFARAGVKAIVDGRNCIDRTGVESLGILYTGIGH